MKHLIGVLAALIVGPIFLAFLFWPLFVLPAYMGEATFIGFIAWLPVAAFILGKVSSAFV